MLDEKIVVIQPIFAIDDISFELQINSLQSIIDYLQKYSTSLPPDKLQFLYGGYCNKKQYWDYILKKINQIKIIRQKINVSVFSFDQNYGKAYIVNYLYNTKVNTDIKWMLTFDSDILFPINESNIFERCVNIAKNINNEQIKTILLNSKVKAQFGMIALNQLEDNCHLGFNDNDITDKQFINNEVVEWHNSGDGIAGGCLFISTQAWKQINGYKCTAIYGGDDGHCVGDMQRHGYTVTLAKSVNIIHPKKHKVNWAYENWKRESLISKESIYGINIDDNTLQDRINKYLYCVENKKL